MRTEVQTKDGKKQDPWQKDSEARVEEGKKVREERKESRKGEGEMR